MINVQPQCQRDTCPSSPFTSCPAKPHGVVWRGGLQSAVLRKQARLCNASSSCYAKASSAVLEGRQSSFGDGTSSRAHDTDFVVIGSGIGGLCCAALLARYGHRVTVCESHYLAGGAAHSFEINGYNFDAGPSFFAGLSGPIGSKTPNPLKQVLNAVSENVDCAIYNKWVLYTPQGHFPVVCDGEQYRALIRREGGPRALEQWTALEAAMKPLQTGAASFPAAAIRSDFGIALTALRFGPGLAKTGLMAGTLTGPFSKLVDQHVTDPWLRKNIDLECFVLRHVPERADKDRIQNYRSGMTAKDTITAEMAFMFGERNSGQSTIDYPLEGSKGIVDALITGIEKYGGRILLRSHVEEVVVEGIDAEGLPKDLECHHLIVNDWDNITAEQNVCIGSIPTVFNPKLAPKGKALVHAYCAANEPYSLWEGLDRKSQEYKDFKEKRSQVLWKALERAIPDIRERTELCLVGSPLTHERYLNRHRGSYGPAISAADARFPGPQTDIPGLFRCGDSTNPGIGVPAAAASGMICANTLSSVWSHLQLLSDLAY